jgi:hypothetical protein
MAELDEIIDRETKDELGRLFRDFPQLWRELIPIEGIYLAPITTDWFFDRVDEETMLKHILS